MNFATYKNMLFNGQRFSYNPVNKHLTNTVTKRAMDITSDWNVVSNVEVTEGKAFNQKWDIEYLGTS
jgi:hypothetical protein